MRTCLGGTFEPLHAGHEALLRAAAEGATGLFVGVTDGKLAQRPGRAVSPWQDRAAAVEAFVRRLGYRGPLELKPLSDGIGPAATGDYERIVASPETAKGALAINVARHKLGKPPLAVVVVPHVLAADLLPVSATRIAAGDIDSAGHRLRPVRIAVGSGNAVKVAAVREELARVLPSPSAEVKGFAVATNVPEQPKDGETLRGARNRARAALAAWPQADYAVGIEAGLVRFPEAEGHLEAQACVVLDRDGWETHGWGPAFHYPRWVEARALSGEMVSDVLGPIAKESSLGSTTGAIGWLTEGRLDRTGLSRSAVLMAFVPRFRRSLYVLPEPAA